jgi:hypothetical protein
MPPALLFKGFWIFSLLFPFPSFPSLPFSSPPLGEEGSLEYSDPPGDFPVTFITAVMCILRGEVCVQGMF